jgi:mannose-6-phosphate isomerase-like protein (cupin superfamily)
MTAPYTLKNLNDVKDSAIEFGLGDFMEGRFAKDDLDAEATGISHHRLHPGKRPPIAHRHQNAEEVYVVIAGSGRVKLDDAILHIGKLDAIRVAPRVMRAFEAGPDGMELLAFGPRHENDGEIVQGWWTD